LTRGLAQRLDLGSLGDVQPVGQHGRPQAPDLGRSGLQRIGLHVGHDDAHAQPGRRATGLQAEARGGAGDDGHAA